VRQAADRYQFLALEPRETHFVFRGESHQAQSMLAYMRNRNPELRERQFKCMDSRTGVIIVRVS